MPSARHSSATDRGALLFAPASLSEQAFSERGAREAESLRTAPWTNCSPAADDSPNSGGNSTMRRIGTSLPIRHGGSLRALRYALQLIDQSDYGGVLLMTAVVSIPRYPGDVTPEWLSAVLSERHPSVEVSDVDVVAIGTGQTGATYRVTARYATDPGDLPETFVIKLPAQDDTVRDRVVIGYRSECAFYSSVVDRVQVPTPECFYCEITEDAMDFALLLADQAPAVQGDQLAGCG